MGKLWVSAAKEVRVLLRDREGVAILFVMPIAFVIIMSLALQDFFRQGAAPQFTLVLLAGDRGEVAQAVRHGASALPYFKVEIREQPDHFSEGEKSLRDEVRAGKVKYALLLPPGLSARHDQAVQRVLGAKQPADEAGITLTLLNDPALRSDHRLLAEAALTGLLSAIDMRRTQARMSGGMFDPEDFRGGRSGRARLRLADVDAESDANATNATSAQPMPSATQQNVPAYSLLAIFLLVVPLSATFIKERDQGTLLRLESMPVAAGVVIGGKVLPYMAINLLQLAVCFAVGTYVLPWLGGEALRMGDAPVAILVLSLAVSLAAIGFGLVVALFARTTEQATAFGATAILLMAALGGIMVPKMLMPSGLQAVAAWSPLGWALDGYLDIFVRGAQLADVLPRAAALLVFATICLAIAMWRYSTRAYLK